MTHRSIVPVIVGLAIGIGFLFIFSSTSLTGTLGRNDNCTFDNNFPQVDRGIRIAITDIEGSRTQDQQGKLVGYVQERQPINITAVVTNTNNSTFNLVSLSRGITIYDCAGQQVLSGDMVSDLSRPINLKPGESMTVVQTWDLKIISQSEPVLVDAPAGKYTVRISFQGGEVQIADNAYIVISK